MRLLGTDSVRRRSHRPGFVATHFTFWARPVSSVTRATGCARKLSRSLAPPRRGRGQPLEASYDQLTKQPGNWLTCNSPSHPPCRQSEILRFMQVPKAIWASMVPAASWAAASEAVTTESTSTAAESVSSAATEAASTGHANWSAQLTNWLAAIDAVLLVSATILTIAVTIREWRIRNEIKEIERKYNPTNANQVSSPKSRPKQTAETPPGNLNRYQRRELRKRRRQDDANP